MLRDSRGTFFSTGTLHLLALPLITFLAAGCTEQKVPTGIAESRSSDVESNVSLSDSEVLTATAELIDLVEGLETSEALNMGRARALRNHLENARRHIERNHYDPAHAQLIAFREQVDEFVADEILTPADALPLLEGVGRIVLMLPTPPACRDLADVERMLQESLEDQEQRPWLRMSIGLAEGIYVNEPVVISVRLTEAAQPLLDAEVQADMHTPDGDCVSVHLLDDGTVDDQTAADGEYTAVFPSPKVPGTYRFVVTANGTDQTGTAFIRVGLISRHADVRPAPDPF